MKLTKGMKKALSLLLSAAMVVTGVNVTANTASAEEQTEAKTSYVITLGGKADDTTLDGVAFTDDKVKESINSWDASWENPKSIHVQLLAPLKEAMTKFKKPAIKIVEASEGAKVTTWSNDANDGYSAVIEELNNGKQFGTGDVIDLTEAVKLDKFVDVDGTLDLSIPADATATIKVYDAAVVEPNPELKEGYAAYLCFTDKNWGWGNWDATPENGGELENGAPKGHGTDAIIKGNGTYTVSINKDQMGAEAAAEGATVFCVDIKGILASDFINADDIAFSDVKIALDGKEYKADMSKMLEGNIEDDKDNYRLEICNAYGYDGVEDVSTKDDFDQTDFKFEESLSVTFTISGLKEGKTDRTKFDKDGTIVAGTYKEGSRVSKATPAPVETPAATATATAKAPAKTPTASAIATKSTITTPVAVGTSKITPKQKTVVVAPNKTVKVGFTATAAKPATKAAVVTATTASKKVATAKVSGKKVVIKAPKKAVKGSSTTVTLKSTNGDKKVSAKIKVYVRNSAKKVKAAKKAITVKKGKTTKLVIKASKVQNKKKAFADTITVKGKVLKLTNVKYAKGKATLTLKGAKKAKKKVVTIKVGSKSVKVKATVK